VNKIRDDCDLNGQHHVETPRLEKPFASWPHPLTTVSIIIDTELESVDNATAKDSLNANYQVVGFRHRYALTVQCLPVSLH
jgi:hypothetical protein